MGRRTCLLAKKRVCECGRRHRRKISCVNNLKAALMIAKETSMSEKQRAFGIEREVGQVRIRLAKTEQTNLSLERQLDQANHELKRLRASIGRSDSEARLPPSLL